MTKKYSNVPREGKNVKIKKKTVHRTSPNMLRAEEGLLGLLQVEQHKVAKEEVEGSDE